MELRQLRYFIKVVEHGSIGGAARDLGLVTSALSQQISRLESELSTRLLQRTSTGVIPTDAGWAFVRQARLGLRHIDGAAEAARQARLSGLVSIGFASTTSTLLAQPLYATMQQRYPHIRLHLVEGLAGNLAGMLNARQLDLAILFQDEVGHNWSMLPVLDEQLFLVAQPGIINYPDDMPISLASIAHLPLAVTSRVHGLRTRVEAAFERANVTPNIAIEIDGLASLMEIVQNNPIATIQPGAALGRLREHRLRKHPIDDPLLVRRNAITSVSDDELSPPALATRVVLIELMRALVLDGCWPGATLHG